MTVKTLILSTARAAGAFSIVGSSKWRRRRLLVLCYHGISIADEHEWNPELYITQQRLRERLQRLRDGRYNILPLSEAVDRLQQGTLPTGAVALTFDDGSFDFAQRAVPVLREFSAPATVYLTTYYCLNRMPVFETALAYLLWRGRQTSTDVSDVAQSDSPLQLRTEGERGTAWLAITSAVQRRNLSAFDKQAILASLAPRIGVDFAHFMATGILQIMSPDQVRNLPHDLVDVQLHTHRHRTPRVEDSFQRELADNRTCIADLTGSSVPRTHFCYPSGDYAVNFLGWLRRAGIKSATTCIPGLASSSVNPLLLPRFIDTMATLPVQFDAWTSGFADLLPRRAIYRLDPRRL